MPIFSYIYLNICLGCSKEPSHRDGSFEYPQHMFWLRTKKIYSELGPYIRKPGTYNLLTEYATATLHTGMT